MLAQTKPSLMMATLLSMAAQAGQTRTRHFQALLMAQLIPAI